MKKIVKYAAWIFALLFLAYGAFCALVYFHPQMFFYNPSSQPSDLSKAHAAGYMAKEVSYTSSDGTRLIGWYTPPSGNKKQVVVFMHGNSHNIGNFFPKLKPFADAGYGTFIPEYRGFGGIKGKITQVNLEADALAAMDYLKSLGYKNNQIIVYGMSLGAHMAVNSVYNRQKYGTFPALILEVPFDNILNVVRLIFPLPLPLETIVADQYDNLKMIPIVKSPVLIMAGSADTLVPAVLAENLAAKAPKRKKVIIYQDAGHNDLYGCQNYNDILSWLKANEKN